MRFNPPHPQRWSTRGLYILLFGVSYFFLFSISHAVWLSRPSDLRVARGGGLLPANATRQSVLTRAVRDANLSTPTYNVAFPQTLLSTLPLSESTSWETLFLNAEKKIAERRAWLSKVHVEGKPFGDLQGARMYYMFQPNLPCFWSFEKKPHSAVVHDGGKWLCGLEEVHSLRSSTAAAPREFGVGKPYPRQCIVYSMGSQNKFDFEKRVREVGPGCEIHTFDPTTRETGDGQRYYDAYHGDYGFAGEDADAVSTSFFRFPWSSQFSVKSLATIMKELGHTYVDYLKLDVEGFEWEFLDKVDWRTTHVGQILMELHPGKQSRNPTASQLNEIFNKLENAGFFLISLEPVHFRNFGQVETVFVHRTWRPEGDWAPVDPAARMPDKGLAL